MTIQFKKGDKVRVLTSKSMFGAFIDNRNPHYFSRYDEHGRVWFDCCDVSRSMFVLEAHQIEPWRDEPPTLSEQLAAKRQESAEMTRNIEKAAKDIRDFGYRRNTIDREIRDLEAQISEEQYRQKAATRLADIVAERQRLDDEEARLRALVTPKIEVGAIVDLIFADGRVRATVDAVHDNLNEIRAVGAGGYGYYRNLDKVEVIFPANHPVAQSLASRTFGANAENGEYREGDVVRVGMPYSREVTLGTPQGVWFRVGSQYVSPKYAEVNLVTPRELRVDIGDASGGEWQRWFAADGEEVAA